MIEVEHLIQYALIYTRIKMTKINITFIYRNTPMARNVYI